MTDKLVYGIADKEGNLYELNIGLKHDDVIKRYNDSVNDPEGFNKLTDQGFSIKPYFIIEYKTHCELSQDIILGVAVEIKQDDHSKLIINLPEPNRHDDLNVYIFEKYKKKPELLGSVTYGFYTLKHEFVDRVKAMKIAMDNRLIRIRDREQIIKTGRTELQSPDLW